MACEKLETTQWKTYFDSVSENLRGKNVQIEVAGLKMGDQIEADWLTLTSLVYDTTHDLFEVNTDFVDHLIRQPKEICIDYGAEGLQGVELVDGEGIKETLKFKPAVALPK